jgi:hypothetical protein
MFILIGARVFSLSFYGVNGHVWVEHLLVGIPGGQTGFLIFVSVLVFLLGVLSGFLRTGLHHRAPAGCPGNAALDIDLIWFGVILGVNMQTSFMHPPFGFSLFYLRSVAPKSSYVDKVTGKSMAGVSTGQIYWGAVPFVVIQVVMIGVVIAFPQLVLHYKGPAIDPSTVQIVAPTLNTLNAGGAPKLGAPVLGAPQLGAPQLRRPGHSRRTGPWRTAAWRPRHSRRARAGGTGGQPLSEQSQPDKRPRFCRGLSFQRVCRAAYSLPACCCTIMKVS